MAKAHTLVDNFNDDSTNTSLWTVGDQPTPAAGRIREVNGRLEIRPEPHASGTNLNSYQSATTYDLTASEARVEVVQALSGSVGTTTFLSARIDG